MKKRLYGTTQSGQPITEYTFTNANQVTVQIINYGGIITAVHAPDRSGQILNVALGLPAFRDYGRIIHFLAASSGAMPTASRRASSAWMAKPITWRSTPASTTCTAG